MDLSTDEKDGLAQLLVSYLDVYAWSYEDMPGLDPSIVQYHLLLLPDVRLVKQKLRQLHHRWSLQVNEEIQKQLSVGFINGRVSQVASQCHPYFQKEGKVRVCVDF